MKVTVCDNNIENRQKLVKMLKQYSEKNKLPMIIVEYDSEQEKNEAEKRRQDRMEFSFVEGKISLLFRDIIYVENERHRQIFHTCSGDYSIYWKLNEIERELKPYGFLRIHQSFLVNMHYVKKINSYLLTMNNGEQLSVPKARYAKVKEQFLNFKGKN